MFLPWATSKVYVEQKSLQLSLRDAWNVWESKTFSIISVNNSCTYYVTNFRTICVYETTIIVVLTQFIKMIFGIIGRSGIFVRAAKSDQPQGSSVATKEELWWLIVQQISFWSGLHKDQMICDCLMKKFD